MCGGTAWCGYKIGVAGSRKIYEALKNAYTKDGARAFDEDFMSGVYERPFEVTYLKENEIPAQKNASVKVGGRYGDRISGGQALGQKNTVLAIWMAQTYLDPSSCVTILCT